MCGGVDRYAADATSGVTGWWWFFYGLSDGNARPGAVVKK
jgi:hypothetical protein